MYRADIDGLRAVAVLCVLLYHGDFKLFSGGFVGVDVFLVLSGFLITRNIIEEVQRNEFSFRRFYVRRTLRLMPALIATLLVTLLVGALIMSPSDYAATGRAAAWAALSVSNIFFARAAAYFDPASDLKPLLHTWSLGVEEQFYLAWPILLYLSMRYGGKRATLWLVVLSIPMGLALSELWVGINPRHAYFLTPFRGFQFMAGAALVWLVAKRLPPRLEQVAFVLGLILVGVPVTIYNSATPFPGLHAVPPTLGAVLLIWAGRAPNATRLLDNPVMVWLGRVSYSVYLVHWPIIVFRRYLTGESFSDIEKVVLVLLSVAVGWGLYKLVEQPFRSAGPHHGQSHKTGLAPLRAAAAAVAATAATGFAIDAADGLPNRLDVRSEVAALARISAFEFLRVHDDGILQLGSDQNGRRILIFGDSAMQNYVPALLELPGIAEARVDVVTRGGCLMAVGVPEFTGHRRSGACLALNGEVHASDEQYDVIFWSQNWEGYGDIAPAHGHDPAMRWPTSVARTLDSLLRRAHRVVVIGPQVRVADVPTLLTRLGPLTNLELIATRLDAMAPLGMAGRDAISDSMAHTIAAIDGALFIDPKDLVCPNDRCILQQDGISLYMDDIHHTAAATPLLASRLKMFLDPDLVDARSP